ncbi:MAG: hypothetical protein ABIQ44_00125 [Chloroflexia bacterium]
MKQVGKAICIWIGIFAAGNLLLWAAMSWLQEAYRKYQGDLPDSIMAVVGLGSLFYVFMGAVLVLLMIWLVKESIQVGVRGVRNVRLRQR